MIRNVLAVSFIVMALSFVAEASKIVNVRDRLVRELRSGEVAKALESASMILALNELPATTIHAVNHVLQIHRENQDARREVLTDGVATEIRVMAERHAVENPEDLVAQHNLGYVLLYGLGGDVDLVRGQDLVRRTERGGLLEAFLLVDPWIFDEPTPPLSSIAYEIMRRGVNWQNRPALVDWISAQLGASIYIGCK